MLTYRQSQILKLSLLHGYLELSDLPFSLRTDSRSFYIMAFRRKRDIRDETGFHEVLELLRKDILRLQGQKKECEAAAFQRLYNIKYDEGWRHFHGTSWGLD